MSDTKPPNPKDAAATCRLPLHLVPDTIAVYAALAFAEGDAKYGGYNWRASEVMASVYIAALRRHLVKWVNGEDADPKTKVPHLAYIITSAGILLDAQVAGKLVDDRPPASPLAGLIDDMEAHIAAIRDMFASHNPKRYTIADSDPRFRPPPGQSAGR